MSTQGRDHASHKTANSEGPINSEKLCGTSGFLLQTLWVKTLLILTAVIIFNSEMQRVEMPKGSTVNISLYTLAA